MCFTYYTPDTACTTDASCPATRPDCFDYPVGGTPNGVNDCVRDMCVDHCCSVDDCPDYGTEIFFCGKWIFAGGDYNICLLHEGTAQALQGEACSTHGECRSRHCSAGGLCRRRCCTTDDCTNPNFPDCRLEELTVHGVTRWLNVCVP